ncbi:MULTISPECIES: Fur-regulated basic protein FbpA [Bacillus]|uniref:Fur-regulated basic protein FbpA n=1 Tax=Bacillus TaxID=1386 RepID=UPI000BB064B1|nr:MULTISPECIES: Fur-regulated basic protein FbpA [Bacillus subtilis group]MCY7784176.1 Fur-regulated basic protein FbpA [Bacillus sp. S20C3]MCY8290319.1 Fur-regulated basic protein FbpA [Bacillus sp. N13C7]MCY8637708.1 Fur-regulated basic protein FbpA [Bacillus sp. S17B2]MCY9144733.1 Fur-regulated basic protein FbpA [Bacillus sp. T9C1]ASZ59910.1 Fur-regulated basic protein FbpA [Bacillus subtilis]
MPSDVIQTTSEERREFLTNELIKYGQYESEDGRELDELSLLDLERLHINVKCKFGREMSFEEGD